MSLFVLCYDIWRTGDITTAAVIHPVFESDSLFPEHAGRGWKHFRFRMIRRVTVHTTPTSRIHNYLSKGYDQKCIVWRDNIELITIESFSNVLCVCECQSLAQTKTWMVPIQWMHTAVNALHPAKTSASLLVPASTSANQSLVSFKWALVLMSTRPHLLGPLVFSSKAVVIFGFTCCLLFKAGMFTKQIH